MNLIVSNTTIVISKKEVMQELIELNFFFKYVFL